jgi:HK97 family phage prohead protease
MLEEKEFDDSERSIVAWASKPVIDRDMELILGSAWNLDAFLKNPVLMLSHDYRTPPIGRVLWTKATDEGLKFKAKFAKSQVGEEIYSLYKEGIMKAFSVGFVPKQSVENQEDMRGLLKDFNGQMPRRVYTEVELLEISCVSIPSCPDALVELVKSGKILTKCLVDIVNEKISSEDFVEKAGEETKEEIQTPIDEEGNKEKDMLDVVAPENEIDIELKPETTENYHHIPVKSAGSFVEGSFRTIDISKSQGIKAVIGKLKSDPNGSTHVQKYLFDANKWTMEEAKKWVADHSKGLEDFIDIMEYYEFYEIMAETEKEEDKIVEVLTTKIKELEEKIILLETHIPKEVLKEELKENEEFLVLDEESKEEEIEITVDDIRDIINALELKPLQDQITDQVANIVDIKIKKLKGQVF